MAGITRDATMRTMTEDDFDLVIDVHLKGHFAPLHFASAYWKEKSKAGEEVAASG